MVYSIVRGGEYFRVWGGVDGGQNAQGRKKKNSQSVDQKISQMEKGREEEKKESRDITGIIKRQEHQAREKE